MRTDLKSTEQEGRQQELVLSSRVVGPGSGLQTQAESNAIVLRGKKIPFSRKPGFAFKSSVNRRAPLLLPKILRPVRSLGG